MPDQTPPSSGWEQELKVWPEFYAALADGSKTFEVRRDDRVFAVGNRLRLREWSQVDGYSGREMTRTVSYILHGPAFGVDAGFVVMGLVDAQRAADANQIAELKEECDRWHAMYSSLDSRATALSAQVAEKFKHVNEVLMERDIARREASRMSETQTQPSSGWEPTTASAIIKRLRELTVPSILAVRLLDQELVRDELERLLAQRAADASQIAALQESEQAVIESARAWAERAEAAEAHVAALSAQVERHAQQARDISTWLSEAGAPAMPIPEAVKWLLHRQEAAAGEVEQLRQDNEQLKDEILQGDRRDDALRQQVERLLAEAERLRRLATEAVNGWACYAKREIEHKEIARLHAALSPSSQTEREEPRSITL